MNTLKISLKSIFISVFVVISLFPFFVNAQDSTSSYKPIPVTKLFYKMGNNFLGSFTYNYGLNYVASGLTTVALVSSNLDYQWYQYTYTNKWIYNAGYSAYYVGEILPIAIPLSIYLNGRFTQNTDMQVTGLAIGQAAMMGFGISLMIKSFTGRVAPSPLTDSDNLLGDFRFGFLRGGVNDGWPSSHTTTAFAMAGSLIALYPANTAIKIGALVYASYIAIGVSTNVHWASDVVAGALIGYAVGTTVGKSFRNMMNKPIKAKPLKLYVTPFGAVLNYKL
jgi:membrane-associated phospholipid phosphatase